MQRIVLAILAGLVLLFERSSAAPEDAGSRAEAYLQQLSRNGRFSGVVLVARNGRPVIERAYGKAVAGWQVANTPGKRSFARGVSWELLGDAKVSKRRDPK